VALRLRQGSQFRGEGGVQHSSPGGVGRALDHSGLRGHRSHHQAHVLHAMGFHPTVCHEGARWAYDRHLEALEHATAPRVATSACAIQPEKIPTMSQPAATANRAERRVASMRRSRSFDCTGSMWNRQ